MLRVRRLASVVRALRRVVDALVRAVPGIVSIGALLVIVFYVGAVMATTLFGQAFPELFGDLGAQLFSLFQIMTLDKDRIAEGEAPLHDLTIGHAGTDALAAEVAVLRAQIESLTAAVTEQKHGDGR